MTKVLVKFRANCADEFDVHGFDVVEKDWWEKYVSKLPDKRFTDYFGSNEELDFNDKANYLASFKVQEISDEDAAILKKFFPYEFGHIAWNENIDLDEEE